MKLWKTWFSHLKHNVFTILIAWKKHHFSVVSSDIKIFMKKVKKCPLGVPGARGALGRGQGGPRGVPRAPRGVPGKAHFLLFWKWIFQRSNEILMFSLQGDFVKSLDASHVLLFFDRFSKHAFCKSLRWIYWKSLCFWTFSKPASL